LQALRAALSVIASEAKQSTPLLPDRRAFDLRAMDCFASLAMTATEDIYMWTSPGVTRRAA